MATLTMSEIRRRVAELDAALDGLEAKAAAVSGDDRDADHKLLGGEVASAKQELRELVAEIDAIEEEAEDAS